MQSDTLSGKTFNGLYIYISNGFYTCRQTHLGGGKLLTL